MSGMTGPELQRELAVQQKAIPIIFITGQRDEATRSRLLKLGAVERLSKLFSDSDLEKALEIALRMT